MKLLEFFSKRNNVLIEGGNLASHTPAGEPTVGYTGIPGNYSAQKIDAKNRQAMQPVVKQLLVDINNVFARQYGRPIWDAKAINDEVQEFISGSSKRFMFLRQPNPKFDPKQPVSDSNPKEIGITDDDFVRVKEKVGDIDTQIDRRLEPQIIEFLQKNLGKDLGSAQLVGYKKGSDQWLALWQIHEPEITLQVDLEFSDYEMGTGGFEIPTEWSQVSRGSEMEDLNENIKGVFRQWMYRSIAKIAPEEKYIAKVAGAGKNKGVKIFGGDDGKELVTDLDNPPPPVHDSNFTFAVASQGGGGVRDKYRPITPEDGVPNKINGIPVMFVLSSSESNYIKDMSEQFERFFGKPPQDNETKMMRSLVGTVELMKDHLTPEQQQIAVNEFIKLCFGKGGQMIDANDPPTDFKTKMSAIDYLLDNFGLQNLRKGVLEMAKQYEADFINKQTQQAVKESKHIVEADPKPNYARQGIPHLYSRFVRSEIDPETKQEKQVEKVSSMEMKDLDFIELCKEIANNGGTLDNIQVNLKVDGSGIRFAKDETGQPLFITSSRPDPVRLDDIGSFLRFNLEKLGIKGEDLNKSIDELIQQGLIDPNNSQVMTLINRGMNYDNAAKIILTSDFIKTLPNDTIVQAEMMYNPMAQKTPDGLKFVNIPYDPKKLGREMTLVPFTAKKYSTGERLPNERDIIEKLLSAGDSNIKLISNKLEQSGIDVGSIVNDIARQASTLTGQLKSKTEKQEAKKILDVARQQLSKAIIENSQLKKGMGILGPYNEGVVVNMPSGRLFKVTSEEMKAAMLAKSQEQKFGDAATTRTAVVAIGNFMGHIGHEELIDQTIAKAKALGGTPFVFVGNKVGPDDPLSVKTKLETLKILFPNLYSENLIRPLTSQEINSVDIAGQMTKKIEYELVKAEPFYNNILIAAGDGDWESAASSLSKRFSSFAPLKHVKVSNFSTGRGTGMSGTLLRSALDEPSVTFNGKLYSTKTPQEKFNFWRMSYSKKLSDDYVIGLMDKARPTIGFAKILKQPTPAQQPTTVNKENDNMRGTHTAKKAGLGFSQYPQVNEYHKRNEIPLNEHVEREMGLLINRILANEVIQISKDIKNLKTENFAEQNYVAAEFFDEFAEGDYWYVKGTPDLIEKFILLANSIEQASLQGTEYEPGKGSMATIHSQLGNDQTPQWNKVNADRLDNLKPINNSTLAALKNASIREPGDEFMSEFLWNLESKNQAIVLNDKKSVLENFADGENPGRKGLAKRMGVPTKAGVSKLRKIAKNSTGEKARMAHWLSNMKAGKNK